VFIEKSYQKKIFEKMTDIKRLIKLMLLFVASTFHKNTRSKVLYYHDVTTDYTEMGTPIQLLSEQFDIILDNGYSIVPAVTQETGQIQVCFDDGWAGLYENKGFFIQKGIKPLVFIAVDLIGKDGYMNEMQIKELMAAGFLFGCHTWSHSDLSLLSYDELQHELVDSKRDLEERFGVAFDSICFPMGRFSDKVLEVCKEAGYSKCYSSISGNYFDLYDRNLICRNLLQHATPRMVQYIVTGGSVCMKNRSIRQQYRNV